MSLFELELPDSVKRDLHHIAQEADSIRGTLAELTSLLRLFVVGIPTEKLQVTQIIGGKSMPVNGVALGGTGTFKVSPIPANGQFQSGAIPQWSTGDTSISLTPSADGLSCDAAVGAGETLPSFGLTVSVTSSNGNPLTKTVSVPVLAAVPVPATDLSIDQIA